METIRAESIDEVELLLYQNNYLRAYKLYVEIICHIRNQKTFSTKFVLDAEDPFVVSFYTRLAFIFEQLITNEKLIIDSNMLAMFMLALPIITSIFEISGFYTGDYLLNYFQEKIGNPSKEDFTLTEKTKENIKRYLLCSIISPSQKIDYKIYFDILPELALPTFLSMLSFHCVITSHTFKRKESLLTYSGLETKAPLSNAYFDLLTQSYMMCSYAARRDKHIIKKELNVIVKKLLMKHNASSSIFPPQRTLSTRPRILIVCEAFSSSHAMYRCFSSAIQELRDHFYLISLYLSPNLDDKAKLLFDENIEISSKQWQLDVTTLHYITQKIKFANAEIIYFPSIGMTGLGITLSNLRLAPIQVMTMGSPATTYSDVIDYAIMEEDSRTRSTDLCSEKLILLPPDSFKALPLPTIKKITPSFRERPNPLGIAIPAKVYKLNPFIFEACHRIRDKAKRNVVFHFFPNEIHYFYQVKKEVLRMLPGSYVYPPTSFEGYLGYLDKLDLYLATFPFSGANSFVDAATLGLPVVTMRNEEVHGVFEDVMITRLELPSWLIANNMDEYVDAAVRIIEDDELRLSIGKTLMEKMQWFIDIMAEETTVSDRNFNEAMWLIYQNHEKIQATSKQAFLLNDLKLL